MWFARTARAAYTLVLAALAVAIWVDGSRIPSPGRGEPAPSGLATGLDEELGLDGTTVAFLETALRRRTRPHPDIQEIERELEGSLP